MRLTTRQVIAGDPLLPQYTLNAALSAALALSPSILIDTTILNSAEQAAYILNGGIGAPTRSFKLQNLADDTTFVPYALQKPNQVTIGSAGGNALRFGFGGVLGGTAGNGYLAQNQNAPFNLSGSYTIGFVVRRPSAAELGETYGGAGPVLGAQGIGNLAGVFMGYGPSYGMLVWHNGVTVADISSGETIGTSISYLITFNASAQTLDIWQNGAHQATITGIANTWNDGSLLYIGAASSSSTSYFAVLDIAGLVFIPGAVAVSSPAATELLTWLAACKANVT
jgi:hypothetical protein